MQKAPFFKRRNFWIGVSLIAVILASAAFYTYNRLVNTHISLSGGTNTKYFYIKSADTYPEVFDNLVKEGFVTQKDLFGFLAQRANLPKNIYPGRYTFNKKQTYIDVIRMLRAGRQDEVKLVINGMITTLQLASLVGGTLEADSIALINMMEDSAYLAKYGFTPINVLCFFVPNTYNFYWSTNAEGFMQRMKREYDVYWNDTRIRKASTQGLTAIEAGILASVVDGETAMVDEMGIVAGLYLNRLKRGMPMQADPTVKYVVWQATGIRVKRVLNKHTQIESPYNTYLHTGLPPGPLALPTKQALEAVLNPSQHNYIYMCAKEDLSGYHNFTDNILQHNLNAARYRLMLDKEDSR